MSSAIFSAENGTRSRSLGLITPSFSHTMVSDFFGTFRNFPRYDLHLESVTSRPDLHIKSYANLVNHRYQEKNTSCSTNSGLSQFHTTLISCKHMDDVFLVHPAGKFMDDIIIRMIDGDSDRLNSLNLSDGNALLEVLRLSEVGDGSSDILSRTRSELFHVRTTTSSVKSIASTSKCANRVPHLDCSLELVQKWRFPEEILSMSVCCSSRLHSGAVLTTKGSLYSWNPHDGPLMYTLRNQRDAASLSGEAVSLAYEVRITEMSLHPQNCHLATRNNIGTIDFRSAQRGKHLDSALLFSAGIEHSQTHKSGSDRKGSITSLCQHATQSQYLFVSKDLCSSGGHQSSVVSLLDTRYPKSVVNQRFIPHSHSTMRFFSGNAGGAERSPDVLLGYSTDSQIMLHTLQMGLLGHSADDTIDSNVANSLFLSSMLPFGTANEMAFWDVTGVPIVDADTPQVATVGATIVPVSSDYVYRKSRQNCSACETRDACVRTNHVGQSGSNFALFTQNSLGDVYTQLFSIDRSTSVKPRNDLKFGIHLATPPQHDSCTSISAKENKTTRKYFSDFGSQSCNDSFIGECAQIYHADKRHKGAFPLPSSTFVPELSPDKMRAFNVLRLNFDELGNRAIDVNMCATGESLSEQQSGEPSISLKSLLPVQQKPATLLEALLEKPLQILAQLEGTSWSLWEIWIAVCPLLNQGIDANKLRRCLLTECPGIREYDTRFVGIGTAQALCDGHVLRIPGHANKEYDGPIVPSPTLPCNCYEDFICGNSTCVRIHQLMYSTKLQFSAVDHTSNLSFQQLRNAW